MIDFRDNRVLIDAVHPLIFFHFQGLGKDCGWFIFNSHRVYRAPFSRDVRNHIYKPYVDELLAIEKAVSPVLDVSDAKPHRRSAVIDIGQYLERQGAERRDPGISTAGHRHRPRVSCVSRHGVLALSGKLVSDVTSVLGLSTRI